MAKNLTDHWRRNDKRLAVDIPSAVSDAATRAAADMALPVASWHRQILVTHLRELGYLETPAPPTRDELAILAARKSEAARVAAATRAGVKPYQNQRPLTPTQALAAKSLRPDIEAPRSKRPAPAKLAPPRKRK